MTEATGVGRVAICATGVTRIAIGVAVAATIAAVAHDTAAPAT